MAQGGYVPLGLRLRATTRLINLKKQHRTPAIFGGGAFGGSVNDRMAQFTHKITQDASHFLLAFYAVLFRTEVHGWPKGRHGV